MRDFSMLLLVLILWLGCSSEKSIDGKTTVKENEIVETQKKVIESAVNVTNKETTIKRDSIITFKFKDVHRGGLLLPNAYKVYGQTNEVVDILNIDKISSIRIQEKSEFQHPQNIDDHYCQFSNFVKIKYKTDTLVLFGKSVLEITKRYSKDEFPDIVKELILAKNFDMEAADDDGLTGCDDYSYIFIEDEQFFIVNDLENPSDPAKLYSNDGVGETIQNIYVSGDTIKLDIHQIHQEGYGTYTRNLSKNSDGWYSFDTNTFRSYTDEEN